LSPWRSAGVEEAADLAGFGSADVAEQGEGLLPARTGGGGIPGAVQGLAEGHQGTGVVKTVAGLTEDGDGPPGVVGGR